MKIEQLNKKQLEEFSEQCVVTSVWWGGRKFKANISIDGVSCKISASAKEVYNQLNKYELKEEKKDFQSKEMPSRDINVFSKKLNFIQKIIYSIVKAKFGLDFSEIWENRILVNSDGQYWNKNWNCPVISKVMDALKGLNGVGIETVIIWKKSRTEPYLLDEKDGLFPMNEFMKNILNNPKALLIKIGPEGFDATDEKRLEGSQIKLYQMTEEEYNDLPKISSKFDNFMEDYLKSISIPIFCSKIRVKYPLESKCTMNDKTIIKRLYNWQNFEKPIEKGGDGRCLFRSIEPQITEKDFEKHPTYLSKWQEADTTGKADLLRTLALETERTFISNLPESYEHLEEKDKVWIQEFYKDALQEIANCNATQTREKVANTSFDEQFAYAKASFEEYYSRTSRPTNWAGTTEAIALSRALGRKLNLFGNDFASSLELNCSKNKILPYQSAEGDKPTIRAFQCNGGGHYQLLMKKAKGD